MTEGCRPIPNSLGLQQQLEEKTAGEGWRGGGCGGAGGGLKDDCTPATCREKLSLYTTIETDKSIPRRLLTFINSL